MCHMCCLLSLWDMPDLRLKGADLDVKPSAPFCPLTLLLYPGLPTEQTESGHPSRRGCLSLGRNSNSPNCSWDYLEDPKSTWSLYGTNFPLWPYLERCNVRLGTDADSWLENSSFGGSYHFWSWMAWMWVKGKEGTQKSPPPYWEPNSSHNRNILPDIFLKDSSEHVLRL